MLSSDQCHTEPLNRSSSALHDGGAISVESSIESDDDMNDQASVISGQFSDAESIDGVPTPQPVSSTQPSSAGVITSAPPTVAVDDGDIRQQSTSAQQLTTSPQPSTSTGIYREFIILYNCKACLIVKT